MPATLLPICTILYTICRYKAAAKLQFCLQNNQKGIAFYKKTDSCQLSVPPAPSWYACHMARNPMRTLHLPYAMLTYCMARAMLLPAQRPTKPTATLTPT